MVDKTLRSNNRRKKIIGLIYCNQSFDEYQPLTNKGIL